MRSFLCADFLVCTFVVIVAMAGLSEAELEQSKNRRGASGSSGLFAFPRVGRSDPSLANSLHEAEPVSPYENVYANSLEDYEELPRSEIKRASLIAFPRVGRTDAEMRKFARLLEQALDKRTGPSATSGLWFGPRLGKRSVGATAPKTHKGQPEHY